jgi:predicted nucleic acid-binding Zn ribbon protein
MPIYGYTCQNKDCADAGIEKDKFFKSASQEVLPDCPVCAAKMAKAISAPNVVFARPFSYYDDPNAQQGGKDYHVAYRIHSSRSGQPEPVIIDSFQKQREFCREEGVRNPADINPNARMGDDGKHMITNEGKSRWI